MGEHYIFRERYIQNTFIPIWTKTATVAFVRSTQKRWTEISTTQRKLTLPFMDQIVRLMFMHIIIYTNNSQTCQTIYMTQILQFVWLHPEIKIQEQDIDKKLLFPCFSLIIDGKKKIKYTSSEFWQSCVPLQALFCKWSLKGACLRKRWVKCELKCIVKIVFYHLFNELPL